MPDIDKAKLADLLQRFVTLRKEVEAEIGSHIGLHPNDEDIDVYDIEIVKALRGCPETAVHTSSDGRKWRFRIASLGGVRISALEWLTDSSTSG